MKTGLGEIVPRVEWPRVGAALVFSLAVLLHAPQEAARILAEAADYARQGQIEAMKVTAK